MHARDVIRALLAGTAAIVSIDTASAQTAPGPAGTAAGTTITNTAQASYSVNGVQQSTTSDPASFVVDRKVNLTVTPKTQNNTPVTVGEANVAVAFQVTNTTNGTQDFLFSASQDVIAGLFTGDNFNVNNLRIFVDSDGNGRYEQGVDTATFINELPADQSRTVFIVGDVPDDQSVALAGVTLIVQVAAGGDALAQGAALQRSTLINDDAVVDVVFADGDSDGLGLDIAYNGEGRASLGFEIATRNVALSVTKSLLVISDPVSGELLPKAIPGAVVQYCLVVNNATLLVSANNVNLTDIVPATMTYQAGSIVIGLPGIGPICTTAGFVANDSGAAIPGTSFTGSYNTGAKRVTATIPILLGGASVAASFRATIN